MCLVNKYCLSSKYTLVWNSESNILIELYDEWELQLIIIIMPLNSGDSL